MKSNMNISCPISTERVNEKVVRIIALLTVIYVSVFLIFPSVVAFIFLGIDFSLRAFNSGKGSFVKIISCKIHALLNMKSKSVDAAPKKFAACLGMIFSISIAILLGFDFQLIAFVLGVMFVLCATMEAAFAICVGCHLYSLLRFIKFSKTTTI